MFPSLAENVSPVVQAIIILGGAVLAYSVGYPLAKSFRMKNYGWKIGLILSVFVFGTLLALFNKPGLGIDLSGGTILVYEIDEQKTSEQDEGGDFNMGALIQALKRRIDPSSVKEIVIRPYGPKQIEIIVPEAPQAEIEELKRRIKQAGYLKFRIVADRTRNKDVWTLGEQALHDPVLGTARDIKDANGRVIAEWVEVGRDEVPEGAPQGTLGDLRISRDAALTRELEPNKVEALMVVDDPRFQVDGQHLAGVAESFDQRTGAPCVNFRMTQVGSKLFGALTSSNLPDKQAGLYSQLGIVMDDVLLSAPTIQSTITSNGQITGNFTKQEVQFLVNVLKAGRLPAVLKDPPNSQNTISPTLGSDTIRKGTIAILASLAAVLIFMLFYYRFAGVVACMALITNLVLIVAIMILIKGAFTLPGLAGLVLTVGMSVDANVLIFERIREELRRDATLRMAIRNGFGRATTTIIDANITTLITAGVLYTIGTDTIRGFAVTLFLGILLSMFTAIFCSRVVFDIGERRGWIKKLGMTALLTDTNWDFLGKRKVAAMISVAVILVGLIGVVMRGKDILDIDIRGGASVTAVLTEPRTIDEVRRATDTTLGSASVSEVTTVEYPAGTVWKIDSLVEDERDENGNLITTAEDQLESAVLKAFANDGNIMTMQHMSFEPPVDPAGAARVSPDDGVLLASAGPIEGLLAQTESDKTPAEIGSPQEVAETIADVPSAEESIPPAEEDDAAQPPEGEQAAIAATYKSQSKLTFDQAITKETLKAYIEDAARSTGVIDPLFKLEPIVESDSDAPSVRDGHTIWQVQLTSDLGDAEKILGSVQAEFNGKPAWLSSNKIGSVVAQKMQSDALAAILVSLLGIIGYIWLRFQRVGFGLAAVVALVHDVSITLGAIALSLWASKVLGFLQIDEFRISLPVVAAFLTIIGYSLNDTIVVFDRIREVRGKNPQLKADMINSSINQTLSRTILTSVTTLLVVLILFFFGGKGIHGFAFALLIGVVVGTYSSVFVASPALLWMSEAQDKKTKSAKTKQPVGATK